MHEPTHEVSRTAELGGRAGSRCCSPSVMTESPLVDPFSCRRVLAASQWEHDPVPRCAGCAVLAHAPLLCAPSCEARAEYVEDWKQDEALHQSSCRLASRASIPA